MEPCPICGGKLKPAKTPFEYAGTLFGEFASEVCSKCGEIYFAEESSDAIDEKAKELGMWGLERKTRVGTAGNSLMVRIPKEIAKLMDLSKGDLVIVRPEGKGKIVITVV